jgi:Flp pilus assembly protein TadB
MTLSRDERAAKIQKTKEERRIRRRAADEKRPWLFPVIVAVAVVIIVVAIVVSIAMGFAF